MLWNLEIQLWILFLSFVGLNINSNTCSDHHMHGVNDFSFLVSSAPGLAKAKHHLLRWEPFVIQDTIWPSTSWIVHNCERLTTISLCNHCIYPVLGLAIFRIFRIRSWKLFGFAEYLHPFDSRQYSHFWFLPALWFTLLLALPTFGEAVHTEPITDRRIFLSPTDLQGLLLELCINDKIVLWQAMDITGLSFI